MGGASDRPDGGDGRDEIATMSGPSVRATVQQVKSFWESHVNNEYYTREARGSSEYFDQIERRRYRWHYHLPELFASLDGRGKTLLEIGCGIGVDSIQLAKAGFHVTAVDLTEAAIDVARRFADVRNVTIDFRTANAERLDFPDSCFDAVYSFGVLHHTPDIERAVDEVRRVLKPGGTAYIMLYHHRSVVGAVHRLFKLPYESPRNLKDHCPVVYTFTARSARALFERFSHVEIHAEYPFTYGFRHLTFWMPRGLLKALGRAFGWHLMIQATR
jgi:ubiquinone/menaquinone biosynthesis C-methylase UbiE